MEQSKSRNTFARALLAASVLVMALGGAFSLAVAAEKSMAAKFDSEGHLLRPEGYRQWVYVGAPVTPNDLNDGKAPFPEFHSVYIDPQGFEVYQKTGKFPDGTVMIKELIGVGSKKAASGNGYFMGDFIGLEAEIKDSQRFPNEPGHWAYFSFTDPGKPYKAKAKAAPTAACNSCHEGNAADDWVFTQYYPVLRAAKATGK